MKKIINLKNLLNSSKASEVCNALFQIYRQERGNLNDIFDILTDHQTLIDIFSKDVIRPRDYVFHCGSNFTDFIEYSAFNYPLRKKGNYYLLKLNNDEATIELICERNGY